jgi:ADP-ribosylglycohydrolase
MGANLEFLGGAELQARLQAGVIADYTPGQFPTGEFTDDTQMTLFTAEGIIRHVQCRRVHGSCDLLIVLDGAYRRWMVTQWETPDHPLDGQLESGQLESGHLVHEPLLHARRAPGTTCLSSLEDGARGLGEAALNDQKGCGTVMRSAPFGVMPSVQEAIDAAMGAARLTHGHPTGAIAAGAFAAIIHSLLRGASMEEAVGRGIAEVGGVEGADETISSLSKATAFASQSTAPSSAISQLGRGWIAEEALAIAVYSALSSSSPGEALSRAVGHDGDSDSTGAICGNMIGAAAGRASLPRLLAERLIGRDLVLTVAHDLYTVVVEDAPADAARYPGF